jgi:hypothetical protein
MSPCPDLADAPDRVLLSISGPFGDDEPAWADAIEATIEQIRNKIPSAQQIILQAVVGGPDHMSCPWEDGQVRASWQHAHIDNAIAEVVGGDVIAGFSPEVENCGQYADAQGHLTQEGSAVAGTTIGNFYSDF